jgi:micrococcal nuclease
VGTQYLRRSAALGVKRSGDVANRVVISVNHPPRRYWHEHRGAALWFLLLLAVWRAYSATAPASPERLEEGIHEVRRAVDGDALLLASGARVRLQGVNTPETVKPNFPVEAWGPEASQFTKDFIEKAGHRVRLTFSLERKDRYDRFLAFVWNGDVMLNEELVRAGLAYARRDYRYSEAMKRRFSRAQDEARRAGRGIWSAPPTEKETSSLSDARL